MNRVFATIASFITIMTFQQCFAQDPLTVHKVNALKGMNNIDIVIRPNTPRKILTLKEWEDIIKVSLHRKIYSLVVSGTEPSSNWLELSIITTDTGGFMEISIYRWVKILSSGEDIYAKVWWNQHAIFGGVSKQYLKQTLDDLLTSFAADYLRANP